jgi:hypothetical protein
VDVQAELEHEGAAVARITAIARREPSICFGELNWGPDFSPEERIDRMLTGRDPGVRFESASRVVVFEFEWGELRYWAGGGLSPGGNPNAEWERICAEGEERGMFPGVPEALAFTEAFLVGRQPIQAIRTPRLVHYRRDTERRAEQRRCSRPARD